MTDESVRFWFKAKQSRCRTTGDHRGGYLHQDVSNELNEKMFTVGFIYKCDE